MFKPMTVLTSVRLVMEKQQGYKIIICQKNKIIDAFYGKNEYTQDLGMEEH